MNYKTFKQQVICAISEKEGEGTDVTIHSIIKNNGIHLDGLVIKKSCRNISPTIYLNYYYKDYKDGKTLDTICNDILSLYHSNLCMSNFDLSFFTDYEKIKDRIVYKLISYRQNEDLLKNVPHFKYLDLAVVFNCLLLDTERGNATILIHHHHLDFWQITPDALYALAKANTPKLLPFEIRSMDELLIGLLKDSDTATPPLETDSTTCPMYVLTNHVKLHGASCLLYDDVLKNFSLQFGCSFYVLPSSIHEVLLLPASETSDINELNSMIKEVNMTQVSGDEILSDHAYFFSQDSLMLSM